MTKFEFWDIQILFWFPIFAGKQKSILKKILPLFSYIFHPIFIPVFGTLLYFYFDHHIFNLQVQFYILLQIAIITIFIPTTVLYLFKTMGMIDSMKLAEISQRKIPLFIQIILMSLLIQKSIAIHQIPALYFFFIGGLISATLAFILLFLKTKASLHMIGICALTIFTIGLSINFQNNCLYLISFLMLMIGFVATSRLEMKAHTFRELLYGIFIGVIPQIVMLWFWL